MQIERSRIADEVTFGMGRFREPENQVRLSGLVVAELIGPDGEIKARCETRNLITQTGDQYYAERAAGIASPPGQVTGMKLGSGSTAVAKTGAGAALATYLTNSHQAIDAGFPTSALNGAARRITWKVSYAAGKATTASPITEAVIVNDALADATSVAANTIARVLLVGIGSKGASDTLALTWTHDLAGS
ncbi:hypothetical protein GCM10010399_82460 [Dactylosporangium fulvum]|uniref:Uncharacterized protein n=1 Tax=Dactylosporangium fulvum TaxID=53359 RepID=A0ABY5W718_9ACTN|nr:hypothetical protein [Dactylosporangium fulvum]UWP85882.1 hypothetical protein Dfulv_17185 [Dactylosporangium fulvum]